jgi:Spermidine/putrescine-binding periplasmic protein
MMKKAARKVAFSSIVNARTILGYCRKTSENICPRGSQRTRYFINSNLLPFPLDFSLYNFLLNYIFQSVLKPFCAFFFAFVFLVNANADPDSKQTNITFENTCHYDEVLTMDVWTSYAPKFAILKFKEYIRNKYSKNIDFHLRQVLTPDEFFDRVRAGITDVISPSHNFFKDERTNFIKNGMVIPLDALSIPNLKNVSPKYITNSFVTEGGRLYGIPLAAGGYSLLFDKSQFKTPPTSWNVLWQPEYKGRYALSKDFYEANIYITALAMGLNANQISDVNIVATPKFRAKLRTLLENAKFWQGKPKDADVKDVILTTAWGGSHSVLPDAEKRWQLAFTQEGVTFWTDYLAVTKNVERNPFAKTLAMEWLNFALSSDYQETAIRENSKYLSPLAVAHLQRSSGIQKTEVQFLYDNSIYWPILSVRNRNGLKVIYDEIMTEIESNRKIAK